MPFLEVTFQFVLAFKSQPIKNTQRSRFSKIGMSIKGFYHDLDSWLTNLGILEEKKNRFSL